MNRGDRRTRRIAGKSDTVDAETAARSVLAGQSTAIPKTAFGIEGTGSYGAGLARAVRRAGRRSKPAPRR